MSLFSQRNLAGGEVAPALDSRVDTIKYQSGVRTGRNYTIIRSGGLQNRPGTKFVGEVKASANLTRMIPFVFNSDQTYILEFGNQTMRVIRNGAYVLVSTVRTITNIATVVFTTPRAVVTTSVAHGYTNGDEVYVAGVVGTTQVNGQTFIVANASGTTFWLTNRDGSDVNLSVFNAYVSGGTVTELYERATPYLSAELMDIQFAQSGDIVTLVHPNYFPRELKRTDHNAWTLADASLVPAIATPASASWTHSSSGSFLYSWGYRVTAVSADTFEEGYAILATNPGSTHDPTGSNPHTVNWFVVTGAAYYNIYAIRGGQVGFVGSSTTNAFVNPGVTPDFTHTPPMEDDFFTPNDLKYMKPACVNYAQQRRIFGNISYFGGTDQPEEVRLSRVGIYNNLTSSIPRQDDDAIRFRMAGRQVNEIRHILDLNKLVIMTSGGEFTSEGSNGGAITSTDINLRQYSYNGSSKRPPIVIDSNALYVQARGSIVRDFGFDNTVDGYKGNDLTVFSSHLFDGYEIVDWAYQKTPNSVVWAVRDDGILLSLTYIRDHQIWGWTRHDTDGFVERVCTIPEGVEDSVYLVIRRTVDERTVRYIERMATRFITSQQNMIFMDSALTYDGRNYNTSHTMTVTQSTGWTYGNTFTLTSSAAFFTAADVGNKMQVVSSVDAKIVFLEIVGYTSGTVVTCVADRDIPLSLRAVSTIVWARAVDELFGLWHLEGKNLSILGDGNVVGSPYNPANNVFTVVNGRLALDDCYGVIHTGLPYISDIETLTIDNPGGESIVNKKSLINQVWLQVEKTRGLWAGIKKPTNDSVDATEGLIEAKVRNVENYDSPVELTTGIIDVTTEANWESNAKVFIRQIDPLPSTILGIHPGGEMPFM